jgi:outer membrane protein assembly factor BamB
MNSIGGHVFGIDVETGHVTWKVHLSGGGAPVTGVTACNDTVIAIDTNSHIKVIKAANGTVILEQNLNIGQTFSSPVIMMDKKKLLIGSRNEFFYCWNFVVKDGQADS